MKKIWMLWGILSLVAITLCSCEEGNELEQYGWYYDEVDSYTSEGFDQINLAIHRGDYSRSDLFSDNGMFTGYNFIDIIDSQIYVVNIVNKNTLQIGYVWLYDPSYVPPYWTKVAFIDGGMYLGDLVYAEETFKTYTYEKIDNKLYASNGDIYTIGNGTLTKDGKSRAMVKIELGQMVSPR